MSNEFPWDVYRLQLLELSGPWTGPNHHDDERQKAADFFYVRSARRGMALSQLFEEGLYSEATSIVRCAFEDWIAYAYVLSGWSTGRWDDLLESVHQTDARVFEGFRDLWGEDAALARFAGMPAAVEKWVGVKAQTTDLASRAREIGLEPVYRVAYPYLSAYSHPTTRPFGELFDSSGAMVTARIPERDADSEAVLALWALWFEMRIMTLANRAYGVDVEHASEILLTLLEEPVDFRTAVLVREVLIEGV